MDDSNNESDTVLEPNDGNKKPSNPTIPEDILERFSPLFHEQTVWIPEEDERNPEEVMRGKISGLRECCSMMLGERIEKVVRIYSSRLNSLMGNPSHCILILKPVGIHFGDQTRQSIR